ATARQAAREGRHDEAERILRAAADSAEGGERLELEIRLAEFLDERGDARASDELKALSDRRPTSPAAQLAVLESRCAWQHEALVRQAIGRLRDASGPDSGVWKQYEARRLLTFSRQPADAAQAVTLLTEALRRDWTNVAAHLLSAEALLQLDDRAAAVEHLTAAVAAAPESPAVYPALIALLHDLGHTDRANRRLSEFARIKELPDDLRRRRAELARRLARWDLAVDDLERLVQSGTAQDALNLANAHAKLGNVDRASELYRQSLEREDRDAAGVIAASDYFAAHDGVQQGLSALDRLPPSVPEPDRTMLRASLLERHGSLDEAEKLYRWAAVEHSSPATWAELGRFLWVAGHEDAARDALARARSIDADDPRVLALGRMLSGGPPGLVDGSPIARDVAAAWEDVRAGGPRAEGGVERLRALAEANPASLEVWAALVEALSTIERHDEAAVAAARAVAALPAEPRATRLATDALERAGRLDEALAMAMQWRSRSLDRPYEPSVAAARLLLITGRVNEAWEMIQPWSERIEREPEADRVATRTLASIHAARGDAEPAGRLVAPALAADAGWLPDYLHVGSWLGEPAVRRAWLGNVPESALRDPAQRLLLAQAWFDLAGRTAAAEDFAHARAEATMASEHSATRLHATLMLAVCAEQSGEPAQAERHYRAALEIDADQPAALNNLAYLLLRNGESTSEAVTLARRACEAAARRGWPDSQRLSLLDTLGQALLANDEPENALRTFEEGLHIAPTDARFLIGCAECALTLGDAVRAEAALRSLEEPIRSGRCPDSVRLRWERARERLPALQGLGAADER
ncbi:MAG TPA: tetratricopeptide repeat protein, partial [Dehalococcoidia bacterium]|nr:tetratricopeptide repeat protein [Dehalococcoidia bacterium]